MKMGEAVTVYISYRMSLGEKARTIGFIIKNFCGYIGADKDLSIISEQHCFHYLNAHGVREGVATTYWFSIYAALNGFFMWAVARRYMSTERGYSIARILIGSMFMPLNQSVGLSVISPLMK